MACIVTLKRLRASLRDRTIISNKKRKLTCVLSAMSLSGGAEPWWARPLWPFTLLLPLVFILRILFTVSWLDLFVSCVADVVSKIHLLYYYVVLAIWLYKCHVIIIIFFCQNLLCYFERIVLLLQCRQNSPFLSNIT